MFDSVQQSSGCAANVRVVIAAHVFAYNRGGQTAARDKLLCGPPMHQANNF